MKFRRRHPNKHYTAPLFIILVCIIYTSLSFVWKPGYSFDWEGIRPELKDSIIQFCDGPNGLTSSIVGPGARTPASWHQQQYFKKTILLEEAILLKKFPRSHIKALAYEMVIRKNPSITYETLKEALTDTITLVYYQSGCIGDEYLLTEYLNEIAINIGFNSTPPLEDDKINLTPNQFEELDSIYQYRLSNKMKYTWTPFICGTVME